jgi:uncharacterized protein (TIGR03437 family)
MNRRRFLAVSALAGVNPGPLSRKLLAQESYSSRRHPRSKMPFLKQLVTTINPGFPSVTPTFAAQFTPGKGGIQLVRSETWDDFTAQTQTQSSNGYVLTAMTSIQNMNRTWFYGAYTQGTGNYQLFRTSDPNAFQQMFTQLASTYTLVDFNIAWELGQVYYSGYWLASAKPSGQMVVWDVIFSDLATQVTDLVNKGMRMNRVQAYPQNAGTVFSAIFSPGSGSYVFFDEVTDTFFKDVAGRFSGNSLVDVSFDPVSGNMVGFWGNKVTPAQFVSNQDWATLSAAAQQNAGSGMILASMSAYPNAPDFDTYFAVNEAPFVEGYAYAVALNGNVISSSSGFARNAAQPANPNKPYTPDTRQNMASSSKAVTGIALQVLIGQNPSITLESPFWPLIQKMVPNPDPSIKVVTLRQLADMKSGMVGPANEGPLDPPAPYTDIWGYLNNYLSQALVGTPGVTFYYSNTNFTILQGVINQVSGLSYVDFVSKYVLEPSGVDITVYNATSDPVQMATLGYSGSSDTRTGYYAGSQSFVAPGGWIASVREMIKPLMALRGTTLMPQTAVTQMFSGLIGWDGTSVGSFGTYYFKNGGLNDGLTPDQWLGSATVRLGEGYDVVMLANSTQPTPPGTQGQQNIIDMVIHAFESRGVPLASEPGSAPTLTSVVHGASFLPNCAPGCYVSIIATGLPGPAVNWNPTTSLPTELNGVEVRVGSQNAYIAYAGPTQVNFLLPSNVPAGLQNVELTTPLGNMQSAVQINPVAPGLFAYQLNGKSYPSALIAGMPIYVAAVGALSGSTSRPATAGDFVELYGTGMGPTNPAAPDGVVFAQAYPAANLAAFQVTIGGIPTTVTFAGLVGPGLYQLDIQIPPGLSSGDQPLTLTVNGVAAQGNLLLTISA